MSSPPTTPTTNTRRRLSNISINSATSSVRQSLSRRSSAAYSPAHSRHGSSHGGGGTLAEEFAELNGGEGLDSLADELDGWDADEGEESIVYEDEQAEEANGVPTLDGEQERDSGIEIGSSPPPGKGQAALNGSLTPEAATKGHQRKPSDYDGSEYGSDSDLESTELVTASLEARLAAVEAMARRGMEENGSEGDRAIVRFTERLNDLGGQTGIETGVQRLMTAYTAISVHLSHQTRALQQLTSTLLSPLSLPPPPEIIDDLLPHIDNTLTLLPGITPHAHPASNLHALSTLTYESSQSLSTITDTLHVNRQSAVVGGRRLRTAKEVLAEWKREWAGREASVEHIRGGDWEHRLRERECAAVCRGILKGFEDTCGIWRQQLMGAGLGAG